MARAGRVAPEHKGRYCGLSLRVWRATILSVRASHWRVFTMAGDPQTPEEARHADIVAAATLLLPTNWHVSHAGRFHPDFYSNRRAYQALWSKRASHLPPGGGR